jgi:hypothetical protein
MFSFLILIKIFDTFEQNKFGYFAGFFLIVVINIGMIVGIYGFKNFEEFDAY